MARRVGGVEDILGCMGVIVERERGWWWWEVAYLYSVGDGMVALAWRG